MELRVNHAHHVVEGPIPLLLCLLFPKVQKQLHLNAIRARSSVQQRVKELITPNKVEVAAFVVVTFFQSEKCKPHIKVLNEYVLVAWHHTY